MSHQPALTEFDVVDRPPIELPHPVRMRVLGAVGAKRARLGAKVLDTSGHSRSLSDRTKIAIYLRG